jgi:hypothetical protein
LRWQWGDTNTLTADDTIQQSQLAHNDMTLSTDLTTQAASLDQQEVMIL